MRSACLQCGCVVNAPQSRRADGRGRYCSRQCAGRNHVGAQAKRFVHGRYARSELACARCGRTFAAKADTKFCSLACAKRPKTFIKCEQCGTVFHPSHLKTRHCSWECANLSRRVEVQKPRLEATQEARRAQRRVAYLVQIGTLVRPTTCEQCGFGGDIEAAHFNYQEPERVRWLCRFCHRTWDHACPKRGTVSRESGNTGDEEKAPAHAEAKGNGS